MDFLGKINFVERVAALNDEYMFISESSETPYTMETNGERVFVKFMDYPVFDSDDVMSDEGFNFDDIIRGEVRELLHPLVHYYKEHFEK